MHPSNLILIHSLSYLHVLGQSFYRGTQLGTDGDGAKNERRGGGKSEMPELARAPDDGAIQTFLEFERVQPAVDSLAESYFANW